MPTRDAVWGGAPAALRAPLSVDRKVDVAVIGAGYTGLWTAYYLLRAAPHLRVALVESEYAGFGASGRNGGWCSALFPAALSTLAAEFGRTAAVAQYREMQNSVSEVGRVAAAEDIACDWAQGGTIIAARSAAQLERARAEVREAVSFGFDDTALLDAEGTRARLNASDVVGGVFTPHCAVVQPRRLARGLADVVTRIGAELYEQTPATAVEPGLVRTPGGDLRADVVVRATEGYTGTLPGAARAVVPVYSLVIATEPLPPALWDRIGLGNRETFSDLRHLVIYGQRTADDRLVFGGRGAPYHFGGRIEPRFDRDDAVFRALRRTLGELFPPLRTVAITHAWGGPLGIARDWHASVTFDGASGLASAGGYVGDGVATANLAGRTLADLITGARTPLTTLPWVGHTSPRWEPEPLRWLGANAALRAMTWADAAEARHGRPSLAAAVVHRALGH